MRSAAAWGYFGKGSDDRLTWPHYLEWKTISLANVIWGVVLKIKNGLGENRTSHPYDTTQRSEASE